MPRFKFPELRPRSSEHNEVAKSSPEEDRQFPDEWERTVRIPVNKEILQSLDVGATAEVMLVGKVEGLQNDESVDGPDRTVLTLQVTEVEAYSEDLDADEDLARGFRRGPRPIGARGGY